MSVFDARPIIASGEEPFNAIMEAVSNLHDGEDFIIIAPFEPVPLEGLLSSQGFEYDALEIDDGDWQVTFRRQ